MPEKIVPSKNETQVTAHSFLGNGFQILQLKKEAVKDLIQDERHQRGLIVFLNIFATIMGAIFAIGAGIKTQYSALLMILGFVIGFVATWVGSALSAGMIHLFAKMFGGKRTFKEFFVVLTSLNFATSILYLPVFVLSLMTFGLASMVFSIYTIIVTIFAIRETYGFSSGQAFFVWFLPGLIIFIAVAIILLLVALPLIGVALGSKLLF